MRTASHSVRRFLGRAVRKANALRAPEPALSREEILGRLRKELGPGRVGEPEMQKLLRQLSLTDREDIARSSRTMVQYYGDEVVALDAAQDQAALRAAPAGYRLEELNGVNVGCGSRTVHPSLLNLDAHKGEWSMGAGSSQSYTSLANLRAWAHELPFRSSSLDFIIALHVLEHVPDPVSTVLHWLDLVKPGGGVGIVVPDWRYTWDARNDRHPWGHRWNPTPELMRELYDAHWKEIADLEAVQTYSFKVSFDFMLRKHGEFRPFDCESIAQTPSGWQLHQSGRFLQSAAA